MRLTLTLITMLIGVSFATAQLNFKAGYTLSLVNPSTFNSILHEHNQMFEDDAELDYTSGFEDLKLMNGFDLGLRYSFENIGIEAGWSQARRQLRADGRRPNGNVFENRITTSINTFSAGLYPTFGPISVGATIDYNKLKIKNDFEAPGDVHTNKDQAWSSRFSLSYDFSNGGVIGVTIRPYIQVYWSEYDLTGFNETINNTEPPATDLKETFASWGFSFIIYNGEQRR